MKKEKKEIIYAMLIFCIICSVLALAFMAPTEYDINEAEIGLRISNQERKCMEFCLPNEYYFEFFSNIGGNDCECKMECKE